jgi:hypothetical protein
MSDDPSDDDFEAQMSDVSERAQKLGVSGSSPSQSSTDSSSSETTKTDAEDIAAAGADTSGSQQSVQEKRTPGGPDAHEYPNPDRELGPLSDVYANNNVFLSPEVVDAVEDLWDDIEYEWKKSHETELNKNWDFYMACFRVILDDPDLVREELGMEIED